MRRRLHYSPDEWDALPWHHQELMLEGLHEESKDPDDPDSDTGPETDGMDDEDAFSKAMQGAKRRRADKAT